MKEPILTLTGHLTDETLAVVNKILPSLPLCCPECKHRHPTDTWRRISATEWRCQQCRFVVREGILDTEH